MIKTADWIIDLGPEGGERGGGVIAEGTPEDVAATPGSSTGEVLAPVLARAERQRPQRLGPARGAVHDDEAEGGRSGAGARAVKSNGAVKRAKTPARATPGKRRRAG